MWPASLAGAGPVTAAELADRASIAVRYAREWLEQQAVAGVVEVDDTAKAPDERRFELPNAHAHVLLDDDSEACMKPCAAVVPRVAKAIEIMVEEFRQGTGEAFGAFDLHDIQAAFTRPAFVNHLTQDWLPEMERFFYAFSTLHCLAVSMQDGGAGTGTVFRPDTLRRYATEAGFATVEPLEVDHPQFALFRLS